MKTIRYIHVTGIIGAYCLISVGIGCRSIVEEVGYHHSDEKKQGMTQWEYDMETQRRLEEQEEEESEFNMMRNQ
jgi:hypothetical protein